MKRIISLILAVFIVVFITSCKSEEQEGLTSSGNETQLNFKNDTKVYKLVIMDSQNKEPYKSARESMLKTLEDYGLIKGKNLKIIYKSIGNDMEKGITLLKEVVNENPDVIFVNGTVMARAARKTYYGNDKYKFVFTCVTDPVGEKLISDFGIPSPANFTGVSYPVNVASRFGFIKELIPNVKTIGLIYADMPQSRSYKKWVEKLISSSPNFSDIKVIFRKVPLIKGENGNQKMAELAKKHVLELNNKVDVFVSPNDQMGVTEFFPKMVWKNAKKPLIGIGSRDVMKGWGATASIFPSHQSMGVQAAMMIMKLFKGKPIKKVFAEQPKKNGIAIDLKKAKYFGIKVPIKFMELAGENIIR